MLRSAVSAFCASVSFALFSSPLHGATSQAGPAVFGTAVLATTVTPYGTRWEGVQSHALGSGAHLAAAARGLTGVERLRFVNKAVNEAIRYRDDFSNWSAGDHWATAAQTFARGAGDCEDYAIAKMQVLRAAGVAAHDLFLVIGHDLAAGDHAILIVRSGNQYWVLNNLHSELRTDVEYRRFRPLITLSGGGSWLHGYRPGSAASRASGRAGAHAYAALAAVVAAQGGR